MKCGIQKESKNNILVRKSNDKRCEIDHYELIKKTTMKENRMKGAWKSSFSIVLVSNNCRVNLDRPARWSNDLEAIQLKPNSHRLECQQRQGDMTLLVYSEFNIMLRTQLKNILWLYFG